MSHIPANAMPHAKPHDEDDAHHEGGTSATATTAANDQNTADQGDTDQNTADKSGRVQAAVDAAREQADRVGKAAGDVAGRAQDAAKAAGERANALPTLVKVLGAAALVGGITAAAVLPFFSEPEDTGRAKRKKRKTKKA